MKEGWRAFLGRCFGGSGMNGWTRREVLAMAGAAGAMAITGSELGAWAQAAADGGGAIGMGKRVLFFTKSQGFPHSVVTRKKGADGKPSEELAFAEKLLKEWGEKAEYAVEVTKEGSVFTAENLRRFDAIVFYTTGDLTLPAVKGSDETSVITAEGKAALLKAIEEGKGFVGIHSATDTFHDATRKNDPVKLVADGTKIDPYTAMIGAEFTSHGSQQKSWVRVPAAVKAFPGLAELKDFEMLEEWYAFTNMARDLYVILVQDTATMGVNGRRERQYTGPAYPGTWARMHGKGRVFYTSMGHREDVWQSAVFQTVLMAGLAWASGGVSGEVKGNVREVCPELT
jgi:type 1 glutamine amidotransferase